MCVCVCVCVRACARSRVRAWVGGDEWGCECARMCVYVCVWGGGGRVCACTCVSYLRSLLTPIRNPMQHRSSGSVSHFTPKVNTNMGIRFFFL